MNPRVKNAKPNTDYTLTLTFTNGEVKVFDVKPYLHIGIFRELKDLSVFNAVKPLLGSIQWQGGQDFCPDTLYEESKPTTLTTQVRHTAKASKVLSKKQRRTTVRARS